MTAMHRISPIIRTGAYSTLSGVATDLLATARLGIVRGQAGIGKSFALRHIREELWQDEDKVFLFEAPPEKSKSVQKFFSKVLFELLAEGHGGSDPFEYFQALMLRSHPFQRRKPRRRILLIVDECQRLGANILEALRGAYDQGALARDEMMVWGNSSAPAFGILLVGNHHFLSKGGREIAATFEALRSRGPIKIDLGRPEAGEYLALSEQLFPENDSLRSALAKHGAKRGNLREMAEAHALARHYAAGGPISPIHLEKAMLFAGGAM